jgi:hypothetical protein
MAKTFCWTIFIKTLIQCQQRVLYVPRALSGQHLNVSPGDRCLPVDRTNLPMILFCLSSPCILFNYLLFDMNGWIKSFLKSKSPCSHSSIGNTALFNFMKDDFEPAPGEPLWQLSHKHTLYFGQGTPESYCKSITIMACKYSWTPRAPTKSVLIHSTVIHLIERLVSESIFLPVSTMQCYEGFDNLIPANFDLSL